MTTLYRSPNIFVADHEWHLIVILKDGHAVAHHRWRPLSTTTLAWSNITAWRGPRPKDLWQQFKKFRFHADMAVKTAARRRAALLSVRAGAGAEVTSAERATVGGEK